MFCNVELFYGTKFLIDWNVHINLISGQNFQHWETLSVLNLDYFQFDVSNTRINGNQNCKYTVVEEKQLRGSLNVE